MPSVPFKKILIANRGEIAVRVICACKELGIQTVAVYSEADRYSLRTCALPTRPSASDRPRARAATWTFRPSSARPKSPTSTPSIPGYGFLSENAGFAEVCEASRIKFIGPRPDVIRLMGVKERARAFMREHGRAGSAGFARRARDAGGRRWNWRTKIGYPVILKASAGGGGRGMRIVNDAEEPACLVPQAQNEAGAALQFAPTSTWKNTSAPRATSNSRFWPTSTATWKFWASANAASSAAIRSCWRNRLRPPLRRAARRDLSRVCATPSRHAGYTNAGTVEFLMDETGKLYFIEVNARVQVEHPVTEFVTGIDIVKSQIRIAQGETLAEILPGPCSCAATPSSAASTRRIPRRSCRRPGASPASTCPAASASAWTPGPTRIA